MGKKRGASILGSPILRRFSLSGPAFLLLCACFLFLPPENSRAATLILKWSHAMDANVAGYKVYYGPAGRDDQFQVDVGLNLSLSIPNLKGGETYSFLVTSYDAARSERPYSQKTTLSDLKDEDTRLLSLTPLGSPRPSIPPGPPGPPIPPGPPLQGNTFPDSPPGCQWAIFPVSQTIDSSGGWGTVGVSAGLDCPWTAVADVPWITLTSNSRGTGNERVYYLVKANPSPSPREGTLRVAGETFQVNQTGRARHALKINAIGPGAGAVASVPSAGVFEEGTPVTLYAAPEAGSRFFGWSGRCSGTEPICRITMDSSVTVVAAFKRKTYVVTARGGPNGSISPSGSVEVTHGGNVRFTFHPRKGFKIGEVKIDGVSAGNPESLLLGNVMNSHRIDALFHPLP